MGRLWAQASLTAALVMGGAQTAHAGLVEEVRVGVLAHNIRVTDPKNADKEEGPAVEVQVNFASPGFLRLVGAPRPYVVGSLNLAGETNFAGGGLTWRFGLGEHWAFEPAFGYVVHDGELDLPFPNSDPRAQAFFDENLLLGSRDLFRTSFGLSRSFEGGWSAELFYSHLSHGQILGEGRNQGLDQAGVRIGYRFGS